MICPDCGGEVSVLLFMGVQPDFLVCSPCGVTFPLPGEGRSGQAVAKVITGED